MVKSKSSSYDLIIFDLDGVIVDSEIIVMRQLSEELLKFNIHIDEKVLCARYFGVDKYEIEKSILNVYDLKLPPLFFDNLQNGVTEKVERFIAPFHGFKKFINCLTVKRKCIATSCPFTRLKVLKEKLNLRKYFGDNIFDNTMVKNGKPSPEIFLLASSVLNVHPRNTIVVEDSVNGVLAARAAGMDVIGFVQGSHIIESHSVKLLEAGAQSIVNNYNELNCLINKVE